LVKEKNSEVKSQFFRPENKKKGRRL